MKNCKTYNANRICSNDYYQHFRNHLLSYDHIQFLIFSTFKLFRIYCSDNSYDEHEPLKAFFAQAEEVSHTIVRRTNRKVNFRSNWNWWPLHLLSIFLCIQCTWSYWHSNTPLHFQYFSRRDISLFQMVGNIEYIRSDTFEFNN